MIKIKDYRIMKRLNPQQWQEDPDWRARRLDFLWDVRQYRSDLYSLYDLSYEKENFYHINDSLVASLASKYHYSVNSDYYNKIYKTKKDWKRLKMAEDYEKLNVMRLDNFELFLNKNNCNLYDYLEDKMELFQEELSYLKHY